jgi:hypothetical protein
MSPQLVSAHSTAALHSVMNCSLSSCYLITPGNDMARLRMSEDRKSAGRGQFSALSTGSPGARGPEGLTGPKATDSLTSLGGPKLSDEGAKLLQTDRAK